MAPVKGNKKRRVVSITLHKHDLVCGVPGCRALSTAIIVFDPHETMQGRQDRIINSVLLVRNFTLREFLNCPKVTQCTTNIVEEKFCFSNS